MKKIDILLKQGRRLFHTNDLAVLWGTTDRNTLLVTIGRYIKKGILFRIHRGFYSTIEIDKINPIALGIGYIHSFAYLSTESVLTRAGVISQQSSKITLVSNVSRKFTLNGNEYIIRKMTDKFLYNDKGVVDIDGIKMATVERAVADLLYFNPRYHFDNKNLVNWKEVSYDFA